ncbi:MAG: hypothetical protein H7Z41_04775 [Cytophagales bacterium]|nr:hypothetical protein [Armatimonadota bacterium]
MSTSSTVDAPDARLQAAIDLVAKTPGYESAGRELFDLRLRGKLRFLPDLADRGQATLGGQILIGPEALWGGTVGLAETLVHEHWHLRRQSVFAKTSSFWMGVATRQPVLRRYEIPAYGAALSFLVAVAARFPELAGEARSEQESVRASFADGYNGPLPF